MKKIIISLLLVASVAASAQTTEHRKNLLLNVGGGMHTMLYNPVDGTRTPGLGGLIEMEYQYMFGTHWGVGLGIQAASMRTSAAYNFLESVNAIHMDNGLAYTLNIQYNDWNELQRGCMLGVPVQLFYRTAVSPKWVMQTALGVTIDVPIYSKYKVRSGDYTTSGYFPSTNVEYYDLPNHGFSTTQGSVEGKNDNNLVNVGVLFDYGFVRSLSEKTGLYLGLYANYGLHTAIEAVDAPLFDGSAYSGTMESNRVAEAHPLMLGAKIGLRFGYGNRDESMNDEFYKNHKMTRKERKAAEKAAAEKAEAEKAAAEKAAADKVAAEKAAAEKAAAEKAAAEKAAAEKAAAEKAAAEKAAAEKAAKEKAEREQQIKEEETRAAQKEEDAKAIADASKDVSKRNNNQDNNESADASKDVSRRNAAEKVAELLKGARAIAYFDNASNSPKVDDETALMLDALALIAKEDASFQITVVGYADSVGNENYNQELSVRRAEAVKKLLVKKGVAANRINTEGKGESNPAADNGTPEGRALNRRAELVVTK